MPSPFFSSPQSATCRKTPSCTTITTKSLHHPTPPSPTSLTVPHGVCLRRPSTYKTLQYSPTHAPLARLTMRSSHPTTPMKISGPLQPNDGSGSKRLLCVRCSSMSWAHATFTFPGLRFHAALTNNDEQLPHSAHPPRPSPHPIQVQPHSPSVCAHAPCVCIAHNRSTT